MFEKRLLGRGAFLQASVHAHPGHSRALRGCPALSSVERRVRIPNPQYELPPLCRPDAKGCCGNFSP
eukprot:4114128-Prorocentrum_lima.AAC.1